MFRRSEYLRTYLLIFVSLNLLLVPQFWLYITSNTPVQAQVIEIQEPSGNLTTKGPVLKIDTKEPLPPNGTVTADMARC